MADGGVGEAAIIAAVAPEVIGGTTAAAGTAAALTAAEAAALAAMAPEAIAVAAPTLAAAAPEALAATAPSLALAAAPQVAAEAPIFLGQAVSEPATSGVLGSAAQGGTVTNASLLGPAAAPEGLPVATPSGVTVGTEAFGPPTDAGLLGNWWNTATPGEKLSAGGKLLSGVSAASKALPSQPAQSGRKTTITPGTTGKPGGGEQVLAQLVESLLKRRDAYAQLGGVPVAYRPRGLLG